MQSNAVLIAFIGLAALVLGGLLAGAILSEQAGTRIAVACIEAGADWNGEECIRG